MFHDRCHCNRDRERYLENNGADISEENGDEKEKRSRDYRFRRGIDWLVLYILLNVVYKLSYSNKLSNLGVIKTKIGLILLIREIIF